MLKFSVIEILTAPNDPRSIKQRCYACNALGAHFLSCLQKLGSDAALRGTAAVSFRGAASTSVGRSRGRQTKTPLMLLFGSGAIGMFLHFRDLTHLSLPAAYSDIDESASVSSTRHQGRHKVQSNFSSTDFSQEEDVSFPLNFSKLV